MLEAEWKEVKRGGGVHKVYTHGNVIQKKYRYMILTFSETKITGLIAQLVRAYG